MRRTAMLSTVIGICLTAAIVTGTASAARDQAAASTNSQWLAKQLEPDGTLDNPNGGTLPDHGLMIDTLFALHASGDGALAAPIVNFLEAHTTDYFTWAGLMNDPAYEAIVVGGAAAKILVAAEVSGRDPRSFGGHDMVAETKAAIMRSGPDKGRVSDYAKNPDFADLVTNEANMFGQSLAIIGLAAAGENDRLAVDKLLTQQCAEGYFRIYFGYIPTNETGDHVTPNGQKVSTCDEGKPFDLSSPDGDATGLALSALLAAREAGVPGLDAPIARTVAWLRANQTAGGGWGGGVGTEAPNTNSTGLIVQALAEAGGADTAVDRGVAFLKSAQVKAADSGNALAPHLGAIAYTPAAYLAGRTGGIPVSDPWVRAGAQASLGLSQVGFLDLAQGRLPQYPPPTTTTTTPPNVTPNNVLPPPVPGRKVVVTPPPTVKAQPKTPTAAARLAAYLANQLVRGDHVEVTQDGKTYVDYDATADVVLALRALDEQPEAVARATKFLLSNDSVRAYAHGAPYEQGAASYAEPLAKLLVIAEFAKADSTQLRADLNALRHEGKFTDTGTFADPDTSVRRHVWAILATPGDSAEAVELLVRHQCADGTFPADLGSGDCESGDAAATAAAVLALNARPHTSDAPATKAPAEWSEERTTALVDAATALTGKTNIAGLAGDAPVSAAVAVARQFAGLDATDTARSLAEQVQAGGALTDFPTSLAAAPGVAGRGWLGATGSPVSPAVRLPLALPKKEIEQPPVAHAVVHAPSLLIGLGGIVVVLVLGCAARRVITRTKGVAA